MAHDDNKQTQTDADTPKMHQVAYLTMQMPIEETKDLFKNINRFITYRCRKGSFKIFAWLC